MKKIAGNETVKVYKNPCPKCTAVNGKVRPCAKCAREIGRARREVKK